MSTAVLDRPKRGRKKVGARRARTRAAGAAGNGAPLFDSERAMFVPREVMDLPDWCEAKRFVTSGPLVGASGTPVRWSNEFDPLGKTIMAAMTDPRWTRVVVMGAPQRSSKTELVVNLMLWTIDQQRANVFYQNATGEVARDVWKKKIAPAIEKSPALTDLIADDREEAGVKERRDFTNGTSLFVRGSESRAALASATAPLTVSDDVQAMNRLPEGDHPADLAMERADAYPADQRRHIQLGQPGMIDDYLSMTLFASAFFVPLVPCPQCGQYQMLLGDRLVYDRSDPTAALHDTWMRCADESCTCQIRDGNLPAMLAEHRWVSVPPKENWVVKTSPDVVSIKGTGTVSRVRESEPVPVAPSQKGACTPSYPYTDRKTTVCGFWRSAFYWPMTSWGALAVQAIEADANPDQKINYQKRIACVPYQPPKIDEDALEPDDIKAHATDAHRWGTVPAAAGVQDGLGDVVLTADVQAGYLWYLAWAWHRATGTAWLIECGRFGSRVDPAKITDQRERHAAWRVGVARALEKLWTKEAQGWPVIGPGGAIVAQKVRATRCLIDCRFLRDTVQLACKRFNGGRWRGRWLPVVGSQAKAASRVPVWPGIGRGQREVKTNRWYWEINVNRSKLYLRSLLSIPPGSDGALNLAGDMPDKPRDWFCKHVCAEEWDESRGKWVQVSKENHLLDCAAEQVAGAMACKTRLSWLDAASPQEQETGEQGDGQVVTDWFKRAHRSGRRRRR